MWSISISSASDTSPTPLPASIRMSLSTSSEVVRRCRPPIPPLHPSTFSFIARALFGLEGSYTVPVGIERELKCSGEGDMSECWPEPVQAVIASRRRRRIQRSLHLHRHQRLVAGPAGKGAKPYQASRCANSSTIGTARAIARQEHQADVACICGEQPGLRFPDERRLIGEQPHLV